MKYKAVWKVVGALWGVGLILTIIGVVGIYSILSLLIYMGPPLIVGTTAGGRAGKLIGGLTGAFGGGLASVVIILGITGTGFIGSWHGLVFAFMLAGIFGVIYGFGVGWWSEKKKREVREKKILADIKSNLPDVTDLNNLAKKFDKAQDEIINDILILMEEKEIRGEIDQSRGVYIPERKESRPSQSPTKQTEKKESYSPETPPQPQQKEEIKTTQHSYKKDIHDRISQLKEKISSLQKRSKDINTADIEKAIDENNLNQAETLLEERKEEIKIIEEIDSLEEEEQMIDTRAIESALEDGEVDKAQRLLKELKEDYEEYKETLNELEELDKRMDKLSKRLADGEIDSEAFKSAKESVENKRYDLEEKLNKLREEVIHEDYEKPF